MKKYRPVIQSYFVGGYDHKTGMFKWKVIEKPIKHIGCPGDYKLRGKGSRNRKVKQLQLL